MTVVVTRGLKFIDYVRLKKWLLLEVLYTKKFILLHRLCGLREYWWEVAGCKVYNFTRPLPFLCIFVI